jgi:uracil-DNA glycosylase
MPSDLSKYGFDHRMVLPQGSGSNGVMIVGEAPGEQEADTGVPFCPWAPAGSVLERAIKRCGMDREQFVIVNTVPWRPPKNWLEGAPWEHEAVEVGRAHLEEAINRFRPRCILALGNVATRATTGLAGEKLGVGSLTGFLLPGRYVPVVPCFHPSFLRRGAMSRFGVMMRCIKLAVAAVKGGMQPMVALADDPPPGYILHPTEAQAEEFARDSEKARYIAYDIETPYSTEEDSAEEAEGEQRIESIQFSTTAGGGIFFPWRSPFDEIARRILHGNNSKLGWNNWRFDDPVLLANGAHIGGESHDLMWAWHHLQPDLPRGLQFAAAQNNWPFAWKHLSASAPEFYGIVDVDVLQFLVREL